MHGLSKDGVVGKGPPHPCGCTQTALRACVACKRENTPPRKKQMRLAPVRSGRFEIKMYKRAASEASDGHVDDKNGRATGAVRLETTASLAVSSAGVERDEEMQGQALPRSAPREHRQSQEDRLPRV